MSPREFIFKKMMKNYKPLFKIKNDEIISKNLLKIGIKENDWYVTIHVRESKFKGEESYRDSNINNYIDAINFINQKAAGL